MVLPHSRRLAPASQLSTSLTPAEPHAAGSITNLCGQNQSTMASRHSSESVLVTNKVPGTRCPTCALQGKEVWVIPGRKCGYCGTPCE